MMQKTNPDITAYRRKKLRNLLIPTVIWCILIAIFELTVFYDYTYENLGIVTAIGLWILLSLTVPLKCDMIPYLMDFSFHGTILDIQDQERIKGRVPGVAYFPYRVHELLLFVEKPSGQMASKILLYDALKNKQLYHIGDRVTYVRGTNYPFIVHREGEAPPAVCVLCGKDNPAGADTCLSCHAELLKPGEQTT